MMGRLGIWVGLLVAACLLQPRPVLGQVRATSETSRGFISINGSFPGLSEGFRDGASFPDNAEQGRLDVDYTVSSGRAFGYAGGVRLVGGLAVTVGLEHVSRETQAVVAGSSPHPFFFSRPRTVTGEVSALRREETVVHIQVSGVIEPGARVALMVFGGPSFFKITQGVVTRLNYDDPYPHDSLIFQSPETFDAEERRIGVNFGADVSFFITRQVGVGGLVRYAAATVALPGAGETPLEVRVGGLQLGGGLRMRF
jgi:hypothetical protein